MEDAIEQLHAKDTKERMAGVERLQTVLEQSRKGLSSNEVGNLVDASLVLLRDNNFRVSQGTLQALASASALAGEHLKLHFNALLPAIVERLGDGKQPVRDAGRRLLLALMEISSPTIIVERAGNCAWAHRNWRVREEFARSVASAINLFAATELPFQRMLLPSVLQLLEDSNSGVREAAMLCLEEMYRQGGAQFRDELHRHPLRPAQVRDVAARFDKIEPKAPVRKPLFANPPGIAAPNPGGYVPTVAAAAVPPALGPVRRSSPRMKAPASDTSSVASDGEGGGGGMGGGGGGMGGGGDRPVEAVRVYSERELAREMERVAGVLVPEQDWSVRISAMQRLEGLVVGGAVEYQSFLPSLKQLVGPLSAQLSDRRSSIVKQACHLLNLMSKELLGDFEIFAESFVPVLFKLVVITVLVIAESADTCIKTMLRNCRVSRVLPKLMDCAKHDRNAVLRARCCEYALLVLEQWGDSPEIQRAADLYEDLIKCCVGDAMSEVRASARTCYRMFAKSWPDRARRMFVAFDPSVQRLLNDEDGGYQKRYLPSVPAPRDHQQHQHHQQQQHQHQQQPPPPPIQGSYAQQLMLRQSAGIATAPSAAPPHSSAAAAPLSAGFTSAAGGKGGSAAAALAGLGIGLPNNPNSAYQKKMLESGGPGPERSLDSVLQASQQHITAVENMLRGVEIGDKSSAAGPQWAPGGPGAGDFGAESQGLSALARGAAGAGAGRDPGFGGSYRRIHAASVAGRAGVDPPSVRDPPQPASAPVYNHGALNRSAGVRGSMTGATMEGMLGSSAAAAAQAQHFGNGSHSVGWDADAGMLGGNLAGKDRFTGSSLTSGAPPGRRVPHFPDVGLGPEWAGGGGGEMKGAKRVPKADFVDMRGGYMDRTGDSNGIPGFQRPLLRANAASRSSASSRSMDENPVLAQFNALSEPHNYMEGLMSLNDAVSEGLSAGADWSARVAAFTFLRNLLQQGPKGLQDINQSFGLVMKLFSAHLDDPHHKVAQAALTTLGELVPACRKPFEAYLERILPQVFARLVDSKEVIRQLGTTALEIVRNTYNIDSLLPALLRSLDEQRSPKAKMAVIEFAIAAFAKLALSGETTGGSSLLKLWLAKLGPLANDKNTKLKETAVTGIISVYQHFDSTTVLNFILSLSIEEQSHLRRSLKQYTPRIEVDLMTYLQNRSQRGRPKPAHDNASSDAPSSTSDYYAGASTARIHSLPASQSAHRMSISNSFGGADVSARKPESSAHPEPTLKGNRFANQLGSIRSNHEHYSALKSGAPGVASETLEQVYSPPPAYSGRTRELRNGFEESGRSPSAWINEAQQIQRQSPFVDSRPHDYNNSSGPSPLEASQGMSNAYGYRGSSTGTGVPLETGQISSPRPSSGEAPHDYDDDDDSDSLGGVENKSNGPESDSPVPYLNRQLENWSSGLASAEKREALQQLVSMSSLNDSSLGLLQFDRIVKAIFEALDSSEAAVKELALSLIYELLGNQKESLLDSTEPLLEKLLTVAQDPDLKVNSAADRCLTSALKELDPNRCLRVVVPRLASDDEKSLVVCIGSLTKLVGRFPSEDLTAELPSFLPALFEAFGNQNADVRKTVVFCLVDIYIVLGKAFVPYLGSLSSTQLRLVTIYANRISQARTGATLESQLQ